MARTRHILIEYDSVRRSLQLPIHSLSANSPSYRHTQIGYVTLATMLGVIVAVVALSQLHVAPPLFIAIGVILFIFSALFSSLTIIVSDTQLESHFGLGVWRKRVSLDDIVSATITRNAWLEGWGIRFTRRGMLYNVSGTRAVEVTLRTGRAFRLGTDEPEALASAIRAAMGGRFPA